MNKTSKIIIWIIVAVIVIGGIWYGMNRRPVEEGTIKIGAILPLSGTAVRQGNDMRKAIEMAAEETSEVDGNKIQLIFEDDESANSPSKTATILHKLIDVDGVKFILGPIMSAEIEATAQVVNKENVIAIVFGAVTSPFSRLGENIFTTSSNFASECNEMVEFIKSHNYQNVFFIGANTDAGLEIKNVLQKELLDNDVNLTGAELINLGITDFKTVLAKAKGSDAIYFWHIPTFSGILLKQARELGINIPLLTFKNIEDPAAMAAGQNALEGVVYTAPTQSESRDKFVSSFYQTYNSKPNVFSDSAYDSINLLIQAIKKNGLEVAKIKSFLKGIKNYSGATGILSYNSNKDVVQDFILKTIKNGQFVPYEE